jgi:hypothetical protein
MSPEQPRTNQAINGQGTTPHGTQVGQQSPSWIRAVCPRGLRKDQANQFFALKAQVLDLPFWGSTAESDQRTIDSPGDGAEDLRNEERREHEGKSGELRLHV